MVHFVKRISLPLVGLICVPLLMKRLQDGGAARPAQGQALVSIVPLTLASILSYSVSAWQGFRSAGRCLAKLKRNQAKRNISSFIPSFSAQTLSGEPQPTTFGSAQQIVDFARDRMDELGSFLANAFGPQTTRPPALIINNRTNRRLLAFIKHCHHFIILSSHFYYLKRYQTAGHHGSLCLLALAVASYVTYYPTSRTL